MQTNMQTKWSVTAVDGYERPILAPVYLTAGTATRAEEAGRQLLKMLGATGRQVRRLKVRIYRPELDPQLHGFVQRAA